MEEKNFIENNEQNINELKIIPMKLNAKTRYRKSLGYSEHRKVVSLGRKPYRNNIKTKYSEEWEKVYKKIIEEQQKVYFEEIKKN